MTALKFVKNSGVMAAASRRVFARSTAYRSAAMFARHNSTKSEHQSTPPPPPSKGNSAPIAILAALAIGGAGYYYYSSGATGVSKLTAETATFSDYQNVYNQIAKKLIDDESDPDEGSYGPVLVRLAWHASGTFDKSKGDGGSYKGTMQYKTELGHGANSGLARARDFLASIADNNKWISHGDLYTLSGVVAIQELGGPTIKWRPGRVDAPESETVVEGRLPDASQGPPHIRDVFGRMGFNDGEMVALIGAHCLGRCHTKYSGYDGPWTFSPTYFTNDFFKLLLDEKWNVRKWDGPKQYQDEKTKSLMMLPADYALVQDKEFKKWVQKYAADNDFFFSEFSKAFSRLLELGCTFKADSKPFEFKRLDDQEN